ncbi:MAG: glycosyltransferase [Pararhizobium sp.]
MKKLLVVCNDHAYFVAHRYAALSLLPEKDVAVLALCGGMRAPDESLAFPVRPVACDRYRLRPLRDALFFVQVLWALVRFRPHVVHTITLKPNLIAGLAVRSANLFRRSPIRLVMMAPGLGRVFAAQSPATQEERRRGLVVIGLRQALKGRNSHVLFENEADRQTWVRAGIVDSGRTTVVSGAGVDPAEFSAGEKAPVSEPLQVLFASRLLKSKGTDVLLDVARRLAEEAVPIRFLVAGGFDARDADAVDLSARTLPPNMDYLGHRSDIPHLLRAADAVLLLTTYAEGLPRILLEGAAMRCALVATDMPGCRRIGEGGRTGYLVPLSDGNVDTAAALAALKRLAADPSRAREMGEAACAAFWDGGFDIATVRAQIEGALFGGVPEKPEPRQRDS